MFKIEKITAVILSIMVVFCMLGSSISAFAASGISVSSTISDSVDVNSVIDQVGGKPDYLLVSNGLDAKQALKIAEQKAYFHIKVASSFDSVITNPNVIALRVRYTSNARIANIDIFENDTEERFRIPVTGGKLTLIKAADASVVQGQDLPLEFNGWIVCNISDLTVVSSNNALLEGDKISHVLFASASGSTNEILYGGAALASSIDDIKNYAKGFTSYNKEAGSSDSDDTSSTPSAPSGPVTTPTSVVVQDFETLSDKDTTEAIESSGVVTGLVAGDGSHHAQLSIANGTLERGKTLVIAPISNFVDAFVKVTVPQNVNVVDSKAFSVRLRVPASDIAGEEVKVRFLLKELSGEVYIYNVNGYSKSQGNATTAYLTNAKTLKTTKVSLGTGSKQDSTYSEFITSNFDGWVTIPWSYFTYHSSYERFKENGKIDPDKLVAVCVEIETSAALSKYYVDDVRIVNDIDKFLKEVGPAVSYDIIIDDTSNGNNGNSITDWVRPVRDEDINDSFPTGEISAVVEKTENPSAQVSEFPWVTVTLIGVGVIVIASAVIVFILIKKRKG